MSGIEILTCDGCGVSIQEDSPGQLLSSEQMLTLCTECIDAVKGLLAERYPRGSVPENEASAEQSSAAIRFKPGKPIRPILSSQEGAGAEFIPVTSCPSCGVPSSVTFMREEEAFLYGLEPHTAELVTFVDKGRCSACALEFTDVRAEEARARAVHAYQKDTIR